MKQISILLIKFYQKAISGYLPSSCRYLPSCSQYALDALSKYNFLKASHMIFVRLLRCNPFNNRGYDPVQ